MTGSISHFTYYKNHTPNHSIDRFLPNGNIEIIIDLTEEPKYIFDNTTLLKKQVCNKIWISGIRNEFITIPSGRDSEMFIVNFKKGMVYPFINMPVSEITDKVVNGDLILNKVFLQIRERLFNCRSVKAKFLLVERILTEQFVSKLKVNPAVEFSIRYIQENPEMVSINKIARETGYSPKHLSHLFNQYVGISPKSFLKIMRFQKSINELELNGHTNFSSLAYDCGYYDQSHFNLDFKSFSGFTPAEYLKKKDSFLNYIPVK